ncbi:hypothetical protein HZB01_04575 [Candidatus Woesearchaeota archaeon]|nr:hypothetical protein [Candidatus Woesearchaeota archaeon]
MDVVQYLLVLLLVVFGLVTGTLIATVTREELPPGKKYFLVLRKVFFLCSITLPLFLIRLWLGVIAFVLIALFLLSARSAFERTKDRLLYIAYAVLFAVSTLNLNWFTLQAAVFFMSGFPVGTLFTFEHRQEKRWDLLKKLFFEFWMFLVVGILGVLLVY